VQPIVTDEVACSVGLSVRIMSLQKQLNRLRCCWVVDLAEPEDHVLDGVQIPHVKGQFLKGKGAAHCKVYRPSAASCAKTTESIKMPFGVWTPVGQRKHMLDGVHIGTTWRMRLNHPCAAAMWSFLSNYFDHLLLLLSQLY